MGSKMALLPLHCWCTAPEGLRWLILLEKLRTQCALWLLLAGGTCTHYWQQIWCAGKLSPGISQSSGLLSLLSLHLHRSSLVPSPQDGKSVSAYLLETVLKYIWTVMF